MAVFPEDGCKKQPKHIRVVSYMWIREICCAISW